MLKLRPLAGCHRLPPAAAALPRRQGAARRSVHRLRQRVRSVRPPLRRHQMRQIGAVRHVAEFDQHRRHVRRLEHDEAGRLHRPLVHARSMALNSSTTRAGELQRKGLGLALRQVDQDVGDVVGLGGEIDAGDHVGLVLGRPPGAPPRRRRRVPTACRRSHPRASPSLRGQRVGMDRDEQRALCARAKRTRSASGMKVSSLRVIARGICRSARACRAASCAKASTMSFSVCAARGHGAAIDAAVAGIETMTGRGSPSAAPRPRLRSRARAARLSSAMVRMKLSRSVAARSSTRRAGWPSAGGQRRRPFDPHRSLGVEHDARSALHHQAVAERLDQPPPLLAGLGREVEGDLRQVEHHAIGIGQGEGGDIDLAGRGPYETGLLVIAADTHGGGGRRCRRHGGRTGVRHGEQPADRPRSEDGSQNKRAECHES